jgi:hypothetical protein
VRLIQLAQSMNIGVNLARLKVLDNQETWDARFPAIFESGTGVAGESQGVVDVNVRIIDKDSKDY